jgi:hypothetical protein
VGGSGRSLTEVFSSLSGRAEKTSNDPDVCCISCVETQRVLTNTGSLIYEARLAIFCAV